jgi:hypothetical protein
MVFNAFKKAKPEIPTPIQMHHYFSRAEWIQAVTSGDSSTFTARRQKTPVLTASTIEEKLIISPDLAPVCTWCAQWLQAAKPEDRRWRNLRDAHETARQRAAKEAASTNSLLSPEFTVPLDARRTSAGVCLRLLLRFANLAETPYIRAKGNDTFGTGSDTEPGSFGEAIGNIDFAALPDDGDRKSVV